MNASTSGPRSISTSQSNKAALQLSLRVLVGEILKYYSIHQHIIPRDLQQAASLSSASESDSDKSQPSDSKIVENKLWNLLLNMLILFKGDAMLSYAKNKAMVRDSDSKNAYGSQVSLKSNIASSNSSTKQHMLTRQKAQGLQKSKNQRSAENPVSSRIQELVYELDPFPDTIKNHIANLVWQLTRFNLRQMGRSKSKNQTEVQTTTVETTNKRLLLAFGGLCDCFDIFGCYRRAVEDAGETYLLSQPQHYDNSSSDTSSTQFKFSESHSHDSCYLHSDKVKDIYIHTVLNGKMRMKKISNILEQQQNTKSSTAQTASCLQLASAWRYHTSAISHAQNERNALLQRLHDAMDTKSQAQIATNAAANTIMNVPTVPTQYEISVLENSELYDIHDQMLDNESWAKELSDAEDTFYNWLGYVAEGMNTIESDASTENTKSTNNQSLTVTDPVTVGAQTQYESAQIFGKETDSISNFTSNLLAISQFLSEGFKSESPIFENDFDSFNQILMNMFDLESSLNSTALRHAITAQKFPTSNSMNQINQNQMSSMSSSDSILKVPQVLQYQQYPFLIFLRQQWGVLKASMTQLTQQDRETFAPIAKAIDQILIPLKTMLFQNLGPVTNSESDSVTRIKGIMLKSDCINDVKGPMSMSCLKVEASNPTNSKSHTQLLNTKVEHLLNGIEAARLLRVKT